MKKFCRRDEFHRDPIMTIQRVRNMDNEIINVEVNLCAPCRVQAGTENARAVSRRQGKGVS